MRDFKGQTIWQCQSNYVRMASVTKKAPHKHTHTQQPFWCPLSCSRQLAGLCAQNPTRVFVARGAWILPWKKTSPQFTNRTPFAATKCALRPGRGFSAEWRGKFFATNTHTHSRGHTIKAAMFARRTCWVGPSKRPLPLPLPRSLAKAFISNEYSPRQSRHTRVPCLELFQPTPKHTTARAPPPRVRIGQTPTYRARTPHTLTHTAGARADSGIQNTRIAHSTRRAPWAHSIEIARASKFSKLRHFSGWERERGRERERQRPRGVSPHRLPREASEKSTIEGHYAPEEGCEYKEKYWRGLPCN